MRWLIGMLLGMCVLFLGVFFLEKAGRYNQLQSLLDEGYDIDIFNETKKTELSATERVATQPQAVQPEETLAEVRPTFLPPKNGIDIFPKAPEYSIEDFINEVGQDENPPPVFEAAKDIEKPTLLQREEALDVPIVTPVEVQTTPLIVLENVPSDITEASEGTSIELNEDIKAPEESLIAQEDISQTPEEISTIEEQNTTATIDPPEENSAEVRAGAQSQMQVALSSNEKGVDIQVNAEPTNLLPENIQLIISETANFRLTLEDTKLMPEDVIFAIWPDSPLTESDKLFYLMNPPNDIMNSYKLKNVVNDDGDLYVKAFEKSAGIFVRNLDALAEVSEFSKIVYGQLAQKQKSLVIENSYFDPNLNELLRETQADFRRVDYVFEQNSNVVTLDRQWQAMLKKAQHGEEIIVLYEMQDDGIAPLDEAIASTKDRDR